MPGGSEARAAGLRRRRVAPLLLAALTSFGFLGLAAAIAPLAHAQARTEAEAQTEMRKPNYARGGFYFGVEGLYAIENSPNSGGSNQFISSGGLEFDFGLRHNRWFATEMTIIYVHTFYSDSGDFLAWGMGAAERLYFSRKRVQPFIRFGMGFLSTKGPSRRSNSSSGISLAPEPGFAMSYGLGTDIYITEDFAITIMADYHQTFGDIEEHDSITAGIGILLY